MNWNKGNPDKPEWYWVAYDSPRHYKLPRQTGFAFWGDGWMMCNGLRLDQGIVAWSEINWPSPPITDNVEGANLQHTTAVSQN